MRNANEKTETVKKIEMRIQGYEVHASSQAGVSTCIGVTKGKRFRIAFDMGSCPQWSHGANVVFVSHCHIDHFGSVFNHARVRSMNNPKKKVIYFVPKECVEILKKIKVMYEQLDAMKTCGTDSEKTDHPTSLPMEFRGVEAGKTYPFPHCKSFYFRVFATDHRVPSVGYAIFERQKGGLIPELVGKSGKEIGEFVKSTGRAANTIRESLEIVYTGDTSGVSLFQNKELQKWLFDCTLFIIEMTFIVF